MPLDSFRQLAGTRGNPGVPEPADRPGSVIYAKRAALIACEKTGRRRFMMELDPLYCDVIVQRWEQFTGKKADRAMTGRSS